MAYALASLKGNYQPSLPRARTLRSVISHLMYVVKFKGFRELGWGNGAVVYHCFPEAAGMVPTKEVAASGKTVGN